MQVPRLTTMLRAYTTERGSDFDVDAEYLKRLAVLKERQNDPEVALGRVGLAQKLFVEWNKSVSSHLAAQILTLSCVASREAKNAYEGFLKVSGRSVVCRKFWDVCVECGACYWWGNGL